MNDTTPFTVLFVCTGNTCRSAMAEGAFRAEAAAYNVKGVAAVSAGLYAAEAMPASEGAVAAAAAADIDITLHRSRQLTRELLDRADLVLVMTGAHYGAILDAGAGYVEKTYLLKEYGRTEVPAARDVADPMGGGPDAYRASFREIINEIRRIMPLVARRAGHRS